MRRKRILILVLICVILAAAAVGSHIYKNRTKYIEAIKYSEFFLGIPCVEEAILEGKHLIVPAENEYVLFEGAKVPFSSKTNTLYLSQNHLKEDWEGSLMSSDTDQIQLYAKKDAYWQKKKEAISENHEFVLWAVGSGEYYEYKLVITGTPIVCINTEYEVVPEPVAYEEDPDKMIYDSEIKYYGIISVFDPGTKERKYELTQTKVRYHEKGASTKNFEKKGYSLSLLDHKEKNLDVSLLGMRSDNSWKLNALVTDDSKVREKSASQIWENFDMARPELNQAGPRMEYVELILDGDYRGLYCLVEPVDEKKLELDNNDVLYKIIDWQLPEDYLIQTSVDHKWRIIYPVRIRYPDVITDYQGVWKPIRDFFNVFYRQENIFVDEIEKKKINEENLMDVMMFIMATSASDNSFKNMYYVAEVDGAAGYVMKMIPWDLDYTFGNVYKYGAKNNVEFDPKYDTLTLARDGYLNDLVPKFKNKSFFEKWQEYRLHFLSFESISELLMENSEYLSRTGAAYREETCWQNGMDSDMDELLEYVEKRLIWLDDYFFDWSVQ